MISKAMQSKAGHLNAIQSPGMGYLAAAGLGAASMYLLDPRTGKRRRAILRDKLLRALRMFREGERLTARDMANRARGIQAEASRLLQRAEPALDGALVERVRAKLGRYVSHPHAVRVAVHEGTVTLSGPILTHEVPALMRALGKLPGVQGVDNQLSVHDEALNISALQGGRPRAGGRQELLQDNWSPTARVLTGALGAGLLAQALRGPTPLSLVGALLGGGLLMRAATNREMGTLMGFGKESHGIDVQKSIHVDAPVEQVFEFWKRYENFPYFMSRVRDVEALDEKRSRWTVSGPAGVPVRWTSELVNVVPNQSIEWRSDADSAVRQQGIVRFDPENEGTRVTVRLCYMPPAGMLGHAAAALFGADPKSDMDADLMRMKCALEIGRTPHDAARRGGGDRLSSSVEAGDGDPLSMSHHLIGKQSEASIAADNPSGRTAH